MAAKPATEDKPKDVVAPVEKPSAPTFSDFISRALDAEIVARRATDNAREAESKALQSRAAAKEAWDVLYDQLVALKANNRESEAFRNSKLGQLLNQIR